jgi:hypothetical protein
MSILGYELTEDQQAMLEAIKAQKVENKAKMEEQLQSSTTDTQPAVPDYSVNLQKWMRKACKHIGKDVEFVADDIPAAFQGYIHANLPKCRTVEDVRELFNNDMEDITLPPDFTEPDITPAPSEMVMRLRGRLAEYKNSKSSEVLDNIRTGLWSYKNENTQSYHVLSRIRLGLKAYKNERKQGEKDG